MLSMPMLETKVQVLAEQRRSHRIDNATARSQLDALRVEAKHSGLDVQFDAKVRAQFADLYDHRPLPPIKLTDKGIAHNVAAGGTKGSALSFHALHSAIGNAIGSTNGLEADVRARVPALKTTTPPPVELAKQFPVLSAAEKEAAATALRKDLGEVRVMHGGKRVDLLTKLNAHPGLSDTQRTRIFDMLAEVNAAYLRAGEILQPELGNKPGGVQYQKTNWKHTRLEVDRVLDVALVKGLSPRDTESALLASIFSDSVKTPANFLVHNVHGAEAALKVLSRGQPPLGADQLEDILKATLEHQIGPPKFMAMCVAGALKGAGVDGGLAGSIHDKLTRPLDKQNQTADRSQILFSPQEKEALAKVGIFAWTVPPSGARHEAVSRAVIDADSLVNYACPDGWAKLMALHGPHQPIFLQEPTMKDALLSNAPNIASAKKSFYDARTVVSPEVLKLYDGGLRRTEMAVDQMLIDLKRWADVQPRNGLPFKKANPYLDTPLNYGNAVAVGFATRLRDHGVELLRQQENIR